VAALRLERKEIILEYLKEVEDMQAFIRSIWHRRDSLATDRKLSREASIRSHQMWIYQKRSILSHSSTSEKHACVHRETRRLSRVH